jgi:hypothetical protein
MDSQSLAFSTAFGLSAAAGLNTTLPLLLVGLLARFGQVELRAPYDVLSSPVVLGGLAVLALAEFVADKVPEVDSVVQVVQWPLAAAAGAILFASQTGAVTWVSPELGLFVGLLTAGGVHAGRMAARPLVTALTGGAGNPAVSAGEDTYSAALASTAVLAPAVGLVLLVVLLALLTLVLVRVLRQGRRLARRFGRRS